jgi:anti-sigma factor RsiW
MHLAADQIDAYVSGRLDEATMAACSAHISLCLQCTQRIARRTQPGRWERQGLLGRLVRAA